MDFDARVPIPISVFPSTYRDEDEQQQQQQQVDQQQTTTTTVQVDQQDSGRLADRRDDSYSYQQQTTTQQGGRRGRRAEQDYRQTEDVRVTDDVRVYDDQRIRPGRDSYREDVRVYDDDRYASTRERVDVDLDVERSRYQKPYDRYAEAQIDIQDRTYDQEVRVPGQQASRYEDQRIRRPTYDEEVRVEDRQRTDYGEDVRLDNVERVYRRGTTAPFVEDSAPVQERERVAIREDTREEPVQTDVRRYKRDMGYYDEDGHYHSLRQGIRRAADHVMHPLRSLREDVREDVDVNVEVDNRGGPSRRVRENVRMVERSGPPNTITIPCHHIALGDLLILQGRPCQVIRITTSSSTGQHRYLGVDLFTKQMYEESSFASNPAASVYVQNMLGPVFKQYRVLDINDDLSVVAMTESGDIRQRLPVYSEKVWRRLSDSFANGRGSVRVLVINDGGRELGVDYKIMYGSQL